jgi:hypothetical protein
VVDEIREVTGEELDEYVEGWIRLTDEPHLRGIEAYREENPEWPWTLTVWVAEFVREEALEAELRDGIIGALSGVPGVTAVTEDDREVWLVAGTPRGVDLVSAAAAVVDAMADRVRPRFRDGT